MPHDFGMAGAGHGHRRGGHGHDHGHDHAHDHGCDHEHDHGHTHGHAHGHHHGPVRRDMAFAVGVGLNGALVACQVGFGLAAGSVALLADATHNLGDVLGLALAWAASVMAGRAPSAGRTYGWGRFSILASLANAVLLLVSIGAIGLGAVQRLIAPAPIDTGTVAWVAGAGIVVNGVTALLFMRGRGGDMNLRAAFTHMVADALLSAGVLAAALVIARTGWLRLDPVMSLILVGVIAAGTWALLRESVNLAMDAVPRGLDEQEIADHLGTLPGVKEVHDLHVWALSTTLNAATVHLVADGEGDAGSLTGAATCTLREKFGIGHVTVQVETLEGAADCLLRPAEVI